MPIGSAPKIDSLYLSTGQNVLRRVRLGKDYGPAAALTKVEIIVNDDRGIQLAAWPGTVYQSFADFKTPGADSIPHGARFTMRVFELDGDVFNLAYGQVVRNDHRFPLSPTAVTTNTALQFTDNFDRDYVGKYWIPRGGTNTLSIHDNPLNIPNSFGPNTALFKDAAALWYAPLNSDVMTVLTSVIYVGDGKFTIVVASDYSMNTWLGIQLSTGLFDHKVRVVRGVSPTDYDDVPGSTPVTNQVRNNDIYVVNWSGLSRTIHLYKNGGSTPLISWVDSSNLIPIGAGYRYTGLLWNTALATPGPEPTSWATKDGW